jgi:hypothetical protein
MNKNHPLILLVSASLVFLPAAAADASTSYFNTVTNLNPVGYWPMHEVEAAAPGDIETNYGSLGPLGTGFYPDWIAGGKAIQHQVPGALANDSDTAVHFGSYNGNSYTNELIIPHTSPLSTLIPPYSVECWVLTTNSAAVGNDAWSQNGFEGLNAGPTGGGSGVVAGTRLFVSGGGITLYGYNTAQNNIGSISGLSSNTWYHVVVTCDANTNMALFVNGTQMFTKAAVGKYVPDYWMPFEVGNGRGNTRANDCVVDELAIYTNVLADVSTHYQDGISGAAGAYFNDVTNDNPVIYLRLDAPAYTSPDISTWPVLTNYGSAAANGVYTPGTMPGIVKGPATAGGVPFGGLPVGAKVAQLGGMSTFADAGYATAYNPVGTTPFSVTAMFRGNPADGRVQTIAGHSDNSWQIYLNTNGKLQCRLGTNTASALTSVGVYNDGNWHQVVEVYSPNSTPGSTGTNALYVDGILDSITSAVSANGILPGTNLDVMIGADPQYTNNPTGAGRQFAGQVCEVALFASALTPNDVATLYNSSGIPPSITVQPISATVNNGAAFTNRVTATGSGPLFYQWYQDGSPRSGQTNASLILNPVQLTDNSADWYVVVSNSFSSVTSSVVSLTVNSVASIVQDLAITNIALFAGGQTALTITGAGALPLHYQWYSNNVAILIATNASYAITNAQPPNTTNNYFCIVTNVGGSATSLVASVAILPDPTAPYPATILLDHPIGFWRLNEPDSGSGNNGTTANDYWGGNDGIYTNTVLGQPSYSPIADPTDTSAYFGVLSTVDDDAYGINIDFGVPGGTSAEFSVEAWVNAYAQGKDSGIVTKGYNGAEQFDLDFVNNTTVRARTFRFFVRDASGAAHIALSNIQPDPGATAWHHLVGVCDEANGNVTLYVDGVAAATAAISPGSGILSSSRSMIIGSRPSTSTSENDLQMVGYMADVAVYNYAISAAQAQNHYFSADVPAKITSPPTNAVASEFGTATFSASAQGTPPLIYRWYDQNNASVPGGTNSTLILTNLPSSANGNSYYVIVTNSFGSDQSQPASLQVVSGPPQIYSDVQSPYFVSAGETISIPIAVYGTLPLFYHWQMSDTNAVSWTNLTDDGRITGSLSNVLTINNATKNDAGDYRLMITNNSGGSAQSGLATLVVGGLPLSFFGDGAGWTATSRGGFTHPAIADGVVTLTDGTAGEGRAFFFGTPQYIRAFKASYTYQDVNHGTADGVAFVLQNDPRGRSALGPTPGTGLGCNGITPGFDMDITILAAGGFGVDTNGATGTSAGKNTGSVSTVSGDPIDVTIFYANGQLAVTLTDAVAQTSFKTNLVVGDLPTLLGDETAYVGFTGADGSSAGSTQTISNFTFVSIPTQTIQLTGSNALISWPGAISSYLLEQNTNLATTNWVVVTNSDNLSNGLHQIMVPTIGTNGFYRLTLPQ